MKTPAAKIWAAQTRANFLLLAVVLFLIGLALSFEYPGAQVEGISIIHAIMLLFGVVFAHASVNLFNEYSDNRTKIDYHTDRNPFSGGSGMIIEGKTKPRSVLFASILTFVVALAVGIFFIIEVHWSLLLLVILGAIAILFYTDFLAKILLGEFFAGLTLGTFVVLGVYVALTASPEMSISELFPPVVIWLSIPPGILTSLLLLLNEFPDTDADREGGRFHLVIWLGKRKAAYIYTFGLAAVYAIIITLPIAGLVSYWIYISLLTLPVAVKTSRTAIAQGNDNSAIIPAMGQNVIIVLATDLLLAIAVFIQ